MLTSTEKWLEPELMDVVRLFPQAGELAISHTMAVRPLPAAPSGQEAGQHFCVVNELFFNGEKQYGCEKELSAADQTEKKSLLKRHAKLALYRSLSRYFGKQLPWGSLTGIRPTRLAYAELEKGRNFRTLFEELGVGSKNIELVSRVLDGQRGIYERREGNCDLYVSLPFCPSKCSYCSFITAPIAATRQYVPAYLDALERELRGTEPFIGRLRSVYVGGGTPFVLEAEQLERVLKMLYPLLGKGVEFTVEAGRPDVFTEQKLELCRKYGVTRICINAQSFSDKTLQAIGRKHTCAQLYEAFEMAKPYAFTVNCDLIAGLTGESVEEFRASVEEAAALSPENITVHTLCLKKGAKLKEEHLLSAPSLSAGCAEEGRGTSPALTLLPDENLAEMIKISRDVLTKSGYGPYYLYRQKYMAGAHENVGWTKPGYASVYNIDVMEESADNLAIGSNAITKRVILSEGRIERIGSPKDIPTYLSKVEKLLSDKSSLFPSRR